MKARDAVSSRDGVADTHVHTDGHVGHQTESRVPEHVFCYCAGTTRTTWTAQMHTSLSSPTTAKTTSWRTTRSWRLVRQRRETTQAWMRRLCRAGQPRSMRLVAATACCSLHISERATLARLASSAGGHIEIFGALVLHACPPARHELTSTCHAPFRTCATHGMRSCQLATGWLQHAHAGGQ